MYILKNAYLNIVRSKGRNILIGIIIMIVTIGSCIAITINKSGNALVKTYKNSNPLEVSFNLDMMNYRDATDEEKESFELLDVDFIKEVGNFDIVDGYYYTLQSYLNSDSITAISYDELFKKSSETNEEIQETNNMPERKQMTGGNYTLIAYSDISYNEEFVTGDKKILEGTMINKDNTNNEIVISEELAAENNLSIGDTITFKNTNDETITYDLKIVGIYQIVSDTNSGMNRMMTSSSNQIYTNLVVLNKIITDDGTDTESYSMFSSITSSFYINYEYLNEFTKEVKELGLSDYYTINTNEDEITETLNPIKNIASFSFTFLIIILIVGGVVLTIINLFNIRERKYEIGVLRAIGMTKFKVTLQLVLEIFIIALGSLIIGTGIGTLLSQPVSNYMLSSEIENINNNSEEIKNNFGGENFERPEFGGFNSDQTKPSNIGQNESNVEYVDTLKVHTDIITIIELFGVGLLLTIISGVVAVTFVNKYEPNKILQNRG